MAAQHFGFAILALIFLAAGVTSRPSNEATTPFAVELEATEYDDSNNKEERSLTYEVNAETSGNIEDILEKIKAVNEGLKSPKKRPPINYNVQPQTGGGYVIDKDILEKLQQIIATGKLNPSSQKYQESNFLNENLGAPRYSRHMPFGLPTTNHLTSLPTARNPEQHISMTPVPYVTNMPVLVMPFLNNANTNDLDSNTIDSPLAYQTRAGPFQWPFAQYFPVLIRDPVQSLMGGGGWSNFIQYGQSADVCNRKQKSVQDSEEDTDENSSTNIEPEEETDSMELTINERQGRALNKRNISDKTILDNNFDKIKKIKKIFATKTTTTPRPVKQSYVEEQQDTKTANQDSGDLRTPFFGDWTIFGNRKPIAPSPGFFINRLKVRRGGVAIAGPGGVATAGRGGAAIVGPGGLAYTQPGGLAVAGPSARVVALSQDHDLSSIVARLQEQSAIDGSVPRLLEAIPEGKVVATGPVIYYHPNEQTGSVQYLPFYGGGKGQYLEVKKDSSGTITSEKIVSEDKISSENILKNSNENLLSKVLGANLLSLKTISTNLLKLHNIGRKTGYLKNHDKIRYKNQLAALGEAASNSIKLIEEIGEDVDMLFKMNVTQRKSDENDDYIEEEGVGIEAPSDYDENPQAPLGGTIIAEAKPVGLAVIGENGFAASRPIATAVASSGVALARPIATAVAGVDPTALGINFQVNHFGKSDTKTITSE